jgi:hypothetical protein
MEFVVGEDYKTRGGWRARCIWKSTFGAFFMHFPNPRGALELQIETERGPVHHHNDGKAAAALVVYEPPAFYGHPADIVGKWGEKKED